MTATKDPFSTVIAHGDNGYDVTVNVDHGGPSVLRVRNRHTGKVHATVYLDGSETHMLNDQLTATLVSVAAIQAVNS